MKIFFTFLLQFLLTSIVFSQGLSLPYSTGFDSPSEKMGWQQFRTGFSGNYDWDYTATGAFSAPTCLFHDYSVGGNTTDTVIDWFVSPPLNFTSSGTVSIKIKSEGFSNPLPDNCEIWFGTNSPNPSIGNFVQVANLSNVLPKYQWLDTIINIPFVSDSGYLALKYKTIGAAWATYAIDDIEVSSLVGVNERDSFLKNETYIFPNPFSSSTTLQFNTMITNAELNLYTVYGKKIRTKNNINENKIKIERENLSSGIYFYELIQDSKKVATGKFVISE